MYNVETIFLFIFVIMTEEERRNCEGLVYLTWDMFDSPDQPGSGYKFMEREPALILDKARQMMQRKMFDIEVAYTSPSYANKMSYSMNNSHRIGKAILLRVRCPKKKWDLIHALMALNVPRIAVQKNENHELVYFDTDDQKERGFFIWILKGKQYV